MWNLSVQGVVFYLLSTNHRQLNCFFRLTSNKTSKFRITCTPCEGNPPVYGGFPSQKASNAENVSKSWRRHWAAICWALLWLCSRQLSLLFTMTSGLYLLSERTSYRKISWSIEVARFGVRLSQSLSRLPDFTRFGGMTSYRSVNTGPGYFFGTGALAPITVEQPWKIRV